MVPAYVAAERASEVTTDIVNGPFRYLSTTGLLTLTRQFRGARLQFPISF